MTKQLTGTREEWPAARLELLDGEPDMSAFVLEDDVVYHTYSTYARTGRPLGYVPVARPRPKGRNEPGVWWRRHDEYAKS